MAKCNVSVKYFTYGFILVAEYDLNKSFASLVQFSESYAQALPVMVDLI